MRFRSLARHLIVTALAAAPGCTSSQSHEVIEQPGPPAPAPIADASSYAVSSTTVHVYTTFHWTKDGATVDEFPDELRITWRTPEAIDPAQPLPLGVALVADISGLRSEAPAEQAVRTVLTYYPGDAVVVRPLAEGFLVTVLTEAHECSPGFSRSYVVSSTQAAVEVDEIGLPELHCTPGRGRRPPGLRSRGVGDWLTEAAHLEAASVPAFERLADELASLGAPDDLITRARLAAADEVRHAAAMHDLGARVTPVSLAPVPPRDAFALALDNAVEGCVEEAFAAILCAYQAAHAAPPLATAMTSIADDECAHADLAFAIADWLEPRLSPADRAAIDAAVTRALASLPARAAAESARHPDASLGLPAPAVAAALAETFAAHVQAPR